jgi:hypothetical protein
MLEHEWIFPLIRFTSIGVTVVATPVILVGFRERAREAARAHRPSHGRSLLRRERPGPKRRTSA